MTTQNTHQISDFYRVIVDFRGKRMERSVLKKFADPTCLRLSLFRSFHYAGLKLEDIEIIDATAPTEPTPKAIQTP